MESLPHNLLDKIDLIEERSQLLDMSKARLSHEVSSWVDKVKKHIGKCGDELIEEMSSIPKTHQVN